MKKLLITTLACMLAFSISSTAKAVVLTPDTGAGITNTAPLVFGTQLVTDYTQNVAYDSISGVLHQDVWLNSTGLLFRYQFVRNDSTGNRLRTMTMTDFTGFYTDVDAYNTSTEELPHYASRQVLGDTITFTFENPPTDGGMAAGVTSAYMWIQTNAKVLTMGETNFINGGIWAVPTYAPAVPEPTSMLLLGIGLVGLAGGRARKRFKA